MSVFPVQASFPATLTAFLLLVSSIAASPPVRQSATRSDGSWTGSWGSSQVQPYGTETLPAGSFDGATLRETVHLSTGGTRIRIHLSNLFGDAPLILRSVHVALRPSGPASPAIQPQSDHPVLFHGIPSATIPMGSEYISDPLDLPVPPLSDLVVSMAITHAPPIPTVHPGARATAYIAPGDHVSDPAFTPALTITRWYFLSGVDVAGRAPQHAAVAFGDSITDGHGATTDGNDRWPDVLARRLAANPGTHGVAVVNQGIGGNRVLADGIGPNGLSRFSRDALGVPGVNAVMVLEGINDIGSLDRTEEHTQAEHDSLVAQLEEAFRQMTLRAHTRGVRVFGCTLTPFAGSGYYHPSPRTEADRTRLNQWIRQSGTFDAVIDFDAALRDPAQPDHLLPAFDSGDHLHPGPAGYTRMGQAVPLTLFR